VVKHETLKCAKAITQERNDFTKKINKEIIIFQRHVLSDVLNAKKKKKIMSYLV
jgi:hypothetical protein